MMNGMNHQGRRTKPDCMKGDRVMPKKPIRKNVEDHFYACDACDYEGGFHVTFKKIEGPQRFRIVLMCPNCSQTYDIGWLIQTQ